MNLLTGMRFQFSLAVLIVCSHVNAQAPRLTDVKDAITTLAQGFPTEKIYLHYDKPSYTAGETVWFKAYIYSGDGPSYISRTMYVDFVNANGRVVKHCVQI